MTHSDSQEMLLQLRDRLKTDLKHAMKTKQLHSVRVVRTLLAALDNAEAVELDESMVPVVGTSNEVPRKILSTTEIHDLLQAEAGDLRHHIADYEALGKDSKVETLRAELAIVERYLPA